MGRHQFLELCGSWLPGGFRNFQYRWCLWSYWRPSMKLLPKIIGLIGEQNFCSLDLAEIKSLHLSFLGSCHDWIAERGYMIAEVLGVVDDLIEYRLLVRLKW
jgi:hypothetical protein